MRILYGNASEMIPFGAIIRVFSHRLRLKFRICVVFSDYNWHVFMYIFSDHNWHYVYDFYYYDIMSMTRGSKSQGVGRWAPTATRFVAYALIFPFLVFLNYSWNVLFIIVFSDYTWNVVFMTILGDYTWNIVFMWIFSDYARCEATTNHVTWSIGLTWLPASGSRNLGHHMSDNWCYPRSVQCR